jgi:hypothetical protein
MDTSAISIGLFLLLIFIGPIAIVLITNRLRQKQLVTNFKKLANDRSITISEIDIIGTTIIGLDTTSKIVAWSYTGRLESEFKTIPLSAITHRELRTDISSTKTIDTVWLQVTTLSGIVDIYFYREDDEETPSTDALACLQSAEYWKRTLSQDGGKKAA